MRDATCFWATGCSDLATLQGVCATLPPRRAYCALASLVRAVVRPCKVAYPDMAGGGCTGQPQPLSPRDRRVCRSSLANFLWIYFQIMNRFVT